MNDIIIKPENFGDSAKSLILGKQGENDARPIAFDYSAWAETYGDGVAILIAKRNGDAAAYPITLTFDGHKALWAVSAIDTAKAGSGSAELKYMVNDVVVKSETFRTYVYDSISENPGPVPDPYESWLSTLVELGSETQIYSERAEAASLRYPYINSTNKHWMVWDVSTGEYVDTGINAQGQGGGGGTSDHTELTNRDADNQHPMSAISGLAEELEGIHQAISGKMEFFKVTYDDVANHFEDTEGNVMNYSALEDKYKDDKYFLYCEYQSVTYIPCLPPDEDPLHPEKVLEFISTWIYGGVINISRLAINENEQIRNETKVAMTDVLDSGGNSVVTNGVAHLPEIQGGGVTDVKVNGTSVVTDGVAEIPIAETNTYGVTMPNAYKGIYVDGNKLVLKKAENWAITSRLGYGASAAFGVIGTDNIDYAVKAALCDGKGAAYTAAEQAAAQERLGIKGWELIETITVAEAFKSLSRTQETDGTPYNFSKMLVVLSGTLPSGWNNLWAPDPDSATGQIFNTSTEVKTVEIEIIQGIARITASASHGALNNFSAASATVYALNCTAIKRLQWNMENNFPVGCIISIYAMRF